LKLDETKSTGIVELRRAFLTKYSFKINSPNGGVII